MNILLALALENALQGSSLVLRILSFFSCGLPFCAFLVSELVAEIAQGASYEKIAAGSRVRG